MLPVHNIQYVGSLLLNAETMCAQDGVMIVHCLVYVCVVRRQQGLATASWMDGHGLMDTGALVQDSKIHTVVSWWSLSPFRCIVGSRVCPVPPVEILGLSFCAGVTQDPPAGVRLACCWLTRCRAVRRVDPRKFRRRVQHSHQSRVSVSVSKAPRVRQRHAVRLSDAGE
jgi:hypothetical protein